MKERLIIDNFFSIGHFDWEIKDFNILTGEMASGKSLSMKLLYFIEQIFHKIIFFESISKETLTGEVFYNNISEKFFNIFDYPNNENNFLNTSIKYTYSNSDKTFDLTAKWNNDKLEWNSEYLNNKLDEWRGYFTNGNTPDAAQNVRTQIYDNLSHDFSSSFPLAAEFIPAARAIAALGNPTDIRDPFLDNFIKYDKGYAMCFDDIDENIKRILRFKNLQVSTLKDVNKKLLIAITPGGKIVIPREFSSGQQELVYFLLFISNLYRTEFMYGQVRSIFIEEPSAHLFPDEQKETIQYIVNIFRELKEKHENKKTRFFISTHSPYVLNVINNMLKKGYLIEKAKDCAEEAKRQYMMNQINNLSFPHLFVDEISAYYIKENTVSMIKESENGAYLYEPMIEGITQKINDDYNNVRDLIRQFR